MKKSYLMIAAAAALFAACSNNDTLRDVDTQNSVIGFETFAQKATKAENSSSTYSLDLKDHHTTFRVWGYKNTSATAVFDGEEVSYASSKWSYTNNRYWDKAATTYQYYAYAPSTTDVFTFNGVSGIATQNAGYFTITSAYTKAGQNVSPKNSTTAVASWSGASATDVDLMIADKAELTAAALTNAMAGKVTLNFIHILSRLNITLKTTDDFYPKVETGDKIVVSNITVGHMMNSDKFDESKASGTDLSGGTNTRWDASGDKDYSYDINYDVTQAAYYVVEALIIPQVAGVEDISLDGSEITGEDESEPFIKIAYSIYNNDKSAHEDFVAFYNLASLFKTADDGDEYELAFNEGWQNTLNITIAPGAIKFDAKVAPWWANNATGAVSVD